MAVANTLGYYDTATITSIKSFIVQTPGSITTSDLLTRLLGFITNYINTMNLNITTIYNISK